MSLGLGGQMLCGSQAGIDFHHGLLAAGERARPLRPERRAIDFRPAQIHRRDPSRVGQVVERIRVEDDEVGALAWRNRSHVLEAQELRAVRVAATSTCCGVMPASAIRSSCWSSACPEQLF